MAKEAHYHSPCDSSQKEACGKSVKTAVGARLGLDRLPAGKYLCARGADGLTGECPSDVQERLPRLFLHLRHCHALGVNHQGQSTLFHPG